ncbi:MAG: multidrug efflux SMR transporter [Planctomycetota bacterium]
MDWAILVLAGLLECCWAVGLKYTAGFTKVGPSIFVGVTLAASMWLLAISVRTLPIGTAYAVWVGIGALGTAICGIVLFKEPLSTLRAVFLILLLASLIGLKLTASKTPPAGSTDIESH